MKEVKSKTIESLTSELLTTDQAAALLGMRARTLDLHRSKGKGPRYVRVFGQIRYQRSDIEAHLRAHMVEPMARRSA